MNRHMERALTVARQSRSERQKVGAVLIVGLKQIDGWNQGPGGTHPEVEMWDEDDQTYKMKRRPEAIHAEMMAIGSSAEEGHGTRGGTLYCTHSPCLECAKLILSAGITKVVYAQSYYDPYPLEFLKDNGVIVERLLVAGQ